MENYSQHEKIMVKAMCLIEHEGKLLLCKNYNKVKKETFFRVVGGTVNFGEKCEEAVRREIKEELNSKIENLHFIAVIENIFTYEGEEGHEIVFLYKGDLSNKEIYKKKIIYIPDAEDFPAEWVPISDILEGKVKLYPVFNYRKLFSYHEKNN